jgi:hypothetical protein
MPYDLTTKDGLVTIKNVPDNVDPNSDEMRQRVALERSKFAEQQPEKSFIDRASDLVSSNPVLGNIGDVGNAEAAMAMGSGMLGSVAGGIAGTVAAPFVGMDQAADIVKATQSGMTYEPRTDQGKERMQTISDSVVGQAAKGYDELTTKGGEYVSEKTGYPSLGALAKIAPDVLMALVPMFAAKKLVVGTPLMKGGQPTAVLRKALNKKGLVYENLTPEAQSLIPANADRSFISGVSQVASKADDVVAAQLKAGARDDSLAGLQLVGGKVVDDEFAKAALKQDFKPNAVRAVQTANASTRNEMRTMLKMEQQIASNKSLATEFRPTDVVGRSVVKQAEFIKKANKTNTRELNRIVGEDLSGVTVNAKPIVESFKGSLDDLNITLTNGSDGWTPNFKGSQISKNPAAQKAVKDAIDLLLEVGEPKFKKLHLLKRQLDDLIDHGKISQNPLTVKAKKLLNDTRGSVNSALREASPAYGAVNDDLSMGIKALDDVQSIIGKKVDLFGKGGDKAIGQEMRKLLTEYKGRTPLDNSIDALSDAAESLGGQFDTNLKDLVTFNNTLADRFGGNSVPGGLQAKIMSAGENLARSNTSGVVDDVLGAAKTSYNEFTNADFKAFEAMDALLKKGSN